MNDRCVLAGIFAEFGMFPDLLALAPGRPLRRLPQRRDDTVAFIDVPQMLEDWAAIFAEAGMKMDHVVDSELPPGVAEEVLLAEDAAMLAERLHLLREQSRTNTGDRLARLAIRRPPRERTRADRQTVVRTVADAVRKYYVGADGLEVVPLLQEAARTLAQTDHVWAKHCPGLLFVEFEALIYWAFEDRGRALDLRDNLVTYRDVAMHRYGAPPPEDGDPDDIQMLHEDETERLYLETEELAARTDLTVTEVRSTALLLVFAGLLRESSLTASNYLTPPPSEDSRV